MASCSHHHVGRWWKHFVILLTPLLLLLPLLLIPKETLPTKANQCLYVMLLMAVYWCTEVLPLAVTSLIPIFVFPMLGILTTAEICSQFLTAVVMMFVGGLMVALAVEKCNLHKRIAVGILHVMGTKPLWLMLGFMLPTGILSMWISNTATTAMMLPISEAVLESLKKTQDQKDSEKNAKTESTAKDVTWNYDQDDIVGSNASQRLEKDTEIDMSIIVLKGDMTEHPDMMKSGSHDWAQSDTTTKSENNQHSENNKSEVISKSSSSKKLNKFAKGMTLAVAYSANIGGTATLIGTPPNTIMKGHADGIWENNGYDESPVTFASWCIVGMPVAIINLVFLWLWLTVFFNGIRSLGPCCMKLSEDDRAVKRVIDREYKALGKISFAEVIVSIMFLLMVLLWFFRSPSFMTGWGNLSTFRPGYTHDAVVSIFIAVVLCIIPSKVPTCRKGASGHIDTLLDWNTIQHKMPWGIVFLIGGGFCLAKASTASGLSAWIAEGLKVMSDWPGWLMVFVICLITAFLTEITSNSATCTILMPIVGSLAEGLGYSPLYLMIPVALSTSFAFMLPVATPPNAIAFSYGRLKIIDMVKGGLILNFICVGVVTLATHTWADAFFKLDVIPWAVNGTTTANVLLNTT